MLYLMVTVGLAAALIAAGAGIRYMQARGHLLRAFSAAKSRIRQRIKLLSTTLSAVAGKKLF